MIKIEAVTEENFKDVVHLKVSENQKKYVVDNTYSLAQAFLYYDETKAYAITDNGRVVGFILVDWQETERKCGLWRFMIDENEQKKGYGKAALEAFITMISRENKFDVIVLSYTIGNNVAKRLYTSMGFVETGDIVNHEVQMELKLTDHPQVGYNVADSSDFDELSQFLKKSKDEFIPSELLTEEGLKRAIQNNLILRYTIFAKTIGISYKEYIAVDSKHSRLLQTVVSLRNTVLTH